VQQIMKIPNKRKTNY